MTMSRSSRPTGPSWDDDDHDDLRGVRSVPGSLPLRAAEAVLRNPVASGGVVLSLVMVAVTVGNALGNQPLRHPHPFFATRAFVEAPSVAVPQPTAAPALPQNVVLPRPKPTSALEQIQFVQELQLALRDHGFYSGPVDGVAGGATSDAIRAFERRLGVVATGEPNEWMIAALRATPIPVGTTPPTATVAQAPAPAPVAAPAAAPAAARTTTAAAPAPARTAAAQPAPIQRLPVADAIAHPVSAEEAGLSEPDMTISTGTIRRAAREPLAPGGDERLQKIQRALIAAGYGPLKADGRWEDRSQSAVRRYEADRGWTVTGRPSDKLVYDLMARITQPHR